MPNFKPNPDGMKPSGFKMKGFSPFHQETRLAVRQSKATKTGRKVNLDDLTFPQAFRKARNTGVKTFTWRDKSYTTKLAETTKKASETAGKIATEVMATTVASKNVAKGVKKAVKKANQKGAKQARIKEKKIGIHPKPSY